MSKDNDNDAVKLQESRASEISRRADELVSGKSLDVYLKERWMLISIKDIGCPFIYDVMIYKQIISFLVFFTSLFFIGSWGFLLMIVSSLGLFLWEFYDRYNGAKGLIREVGGHDKAASIINTFSVSNYTEGLAPWQLKQLKEHNRTVSEIKAKLEAIEKNEKENKALKNDKNHRLIKEDLLARKARVNKKQPLFVMMFCLHMYKGLISKIMSLN